MIPAKVFLSSALWNIRDEAAERRMLAVKQRLDSLPSQGMPYPGSLNEYPELRKYSSKISKILFKDIEYIPLGKNYKLGRYPIPFGPFKGFSSKEGEWYYEM